MFILLIHSLLNLLTNSITQSFTHLAAWKWFLTVNTIQILMLLNGVKLFTKVFLSHEMSLGWFLNIAL